MEADIAYSLDKNIEEENWRRRCGCLRTSEKLKRILDCFPAPPPPTPESPKSNNHGTTCISAYCTNLHQSAKANDEMRMAKSCMDLYDSIAEKPLKKEELKTLPCITREQEGRKEVEKLLKNDTYLIEDPKVNKKTELVEQLSERTWRVVGEIVQLVQLSVTATALALYYLIYCYMQLIYYTLLSALYFHNADGAMKITIAVVTITSLFVAFNILLKMERVLFIFH